MVGLANSLTQTVTLLESDMLGTLIACYIYLFLILFVSFINVYAADKYEFLNNIQKCIEFRRKVFFIVHYSKHKYIISLKTFVMEVIGYVLAICMIGAFLLSLNLEVSDALIVVSVLALIILVFGCITGSMYRKAKRSK